MAPISPRCPFLPSALLLAALSAHSVDSGLPIAGLSKWDRVHFVTGLKCELFPSLLILFLLLLGLPPSLLPSQHRPQTKSRGFSSKVVLVPFSTLSSIQLDFGHLLSPGALC